MQDQGSNLFVQQQKEVARDNVSDKEKIGAVMQEDSHTQVIPQSFSLISGLGMAFSITNSWVTYLSLLGQNLAYGGPQSVILGLLVATFIQWIFTLGLSELASAFPSSGGQYHYVYILAPKRSRRFLSFFIGWFSVFGWWIGASGGAAIVVNNIFGLISFWDKNFVATQWMTYLAYLAVVIVTFLPQYFTPKLVPKITAISLWLSLIGFVVTFIVILAMRKHSNSSSFVLESNLGKSGWPQGTAWLLGIVNQMLVYGATDAVIHIAEEMPRPRIQVPIVMNSCILIGACTVFPLAAVLMYSMTDIEAVSAAALPCVELLFQATGSKPVTTFLMCWAILAYISAVCAAWVAGGRLAWAFARDGGVPFRTYFMHIDEKRGFPLRATVATVLFVCVYGLLFLASTTAFNSILTSAVLFLTVTFAVPQGLVAARGRTKLLPDRPLDLGRYGYVVNISVAAIGVLIVVLACFPPGLPVATSNMNYSSVIVVGLFGILTVFWFTIGTRNFEGPILDAVSSNLKSQVE